VDNEVADTLSRLLPADRNEWSLSTGALNAITTRWGRLEIDSFASPTNHRLALFYSRQPCSTALAIDAFQQSWTTGIGLFVPPINVINRVIAKIGEDRAHDVLVVPDWPSRPWYGAVMALAIGSPLRLGSAACVEAPGAPLLRGKPPPRLLAVRF
jgi:hypothetical protein